VAAPHVRPISRRLWNASAAGVGLALALLVPARGLRAQAGGDAIVQPAAATPQAFIDRAFEMRRVAEQAGDQGYGAVVARGGLIVGQAPSGVVTRRDPTAHAEMDAIRDAARRLGTRDLSDCTLYSSSRPCPMCEAAAYWAGISRMVHGASLADAGRPALRCN
jgi:tRNA(Arg) A34 adenosine deaminase TadA